MVYIFSTSIQKRNLARSPPRSLMLWRRFVTERWTLIYAKVTMGFLDLVPQGLRPILHSAKRKRAEILLYLSSFPFLSFFSLLEAGIPSTGPLPRERDFPSPFSNPCKRRPSPGRLTSFWDPVSGPSARHAAGAVAAGRAEAVGTGGDNPGISRPRDQPPASKRGYFSSRISRARL